MGQCDFTYAIPADFERRVVQILQQKPMGIAIATAFQSCSYEYEDMGLAYYAGVKGDNWDKRALDFTIEGSEKHINILNSRSDDLDDAFSKALRPSTSGFLVRDILFLCSEVEAFLPLSDKERLNTDMETASLVLKDLVRIGERLCSNVTYRHVGSENSINDFFRDALSLMGYSEVKDQTRHGISINGKDAGEVDILITKDNKEIAIFEGLVLDNVSTAYINTHIDKAIINYNALGTATFIVAYVTTANFESFWNRYIAHLRGYEFPLLIKESLNVKASPNAATRIAKMILSRDDYDFPVYFVALNVS